MDVGIALATLETALPIIDWLAGLNAELTASPVVLAEEGRDSGRETEPVVVRCGVTASGEGERWDETSFAVVPLTDGAPEVLSAGRKTTRIFFSWMVCLAVCSMWLHYIPISPYSCTKCGGLSYNGANVAKLHVGGHSDGLDKELVTATGIWRRVLLHGLKQN